MKPYAINGLAFSFLFCACLASTFRNTYALDVNGSINDGYDGFLVSCAGDSSIKLEYSIRVTEVNPVCGKASNTFSSVPPQEGLCSEGTPSSSALLPDGRFYWSCTGDAATIPSVCYTSNGKLNQSPLNLLVPGSLPEDNPPSIQVSVSNGAKSSVASAAYGTASALKTLDGGGNYFVKVEKVANPSSGNKVGNLYYDFYASCMKNNSHQPTSDVIYQTNDSPSSDINYLALAGIGQKVLINAQGGSGSGAVKFSVSSAGIGKCKTKLSRNKVIVSNTKSGICRVSASKPANNKYNSVSAWPATIEFR